MELAGFTLGVSGELMIAYTVIAVHYRISKKHQIDDAVIGTMRRERIIGVLGIVAIVLGYFLELPHKL